MNGRKRHLLVDTLGLLLRVRVTAGKVDDRDGGTRRRWLPAGTEPPVVPRFAVVPRRWVVVRSFAWLGRYRRLSRDYEYAPATSEAVIQLAMGLLLLRRPTSS